jgi:uncharacterized protein
MTDAAPAPVALAERIVMLDVVRGLAVLGILVMNVVEFGQPIRAYENPAGGGGSTGLDLWVWYVQMALFDGKMRALFSMLFGAGLLLLATRVSARGGEAADLLLRRCLWLVPFGIAHRFGLQWTGDILYMYGLLGLIAVALRNLRARSQILAGCLCLAMFIPIELWHHHQSATVRDQAARASAMAAAGETVPQDLKDAQARWERRLTPPKPEAVKPEIEAMRGSYATVFAYRWEYHHSFQSAYLYYYFVWDVLGMMLLGMGLLQLGFFAGRWSTTAYAMVIAVGLAVAAASFLWARVWAAADFSNGEIELRTLKAAAYPFARGLVGLAWAAVFILLVRANRAAWVTGPLAAVGRMAFSNYVLQTVCCTLLFFGYGLGKYAEFSRSQLMLVWVGVSAVQVVFSLVWLRLFRFGPLEWAWRCLTYWRWQPLLRGSSA